MLKCGSEHTSQMNTCSDTAPILYIDSPILTKYELSRILGIRVAQLSMSATPQITLDPQKNYTLLQIAAIEIKERALETNVRRNLPHGKYIDIALRDIELPNDLNDILEMVNA